MIFHHHVPSPQPFPSPSPEVGITEVPGWEEPTRIIVLTTPDGVRQWRCEGLASNVTPEGLRVLADLLEQAEARHAASLLSGPHRVPADAESKAG